ncbi:hypothetical protein BH23PLA1_BH23PLA1_37720 [soil metagenome]
MRGAASSLTDTAPPAADATPPEAPKARRRRRFWIGLAALALVLLVLFLAHRPLLVGYAHLFRVHDPAPSDAIVAVGDCGIDPCR